VHVANVLAEMPPGDPSAARNDLDAAYLERLGIAEALPAWSHMTRQHFALEFTE
jgi:hypothetical protein